MRKMTNYLLPLFLTLLPTLSTANLTEFVEVGGYIPDTKTKEYFTLYTHEEDVDIVFSYPDDADFWVTVKGELGENLGDFQLSTGNIINLTGGGTFSLIVYAKSGDGEWFAWVEEP